jgi:DMSO/TMAO reductase YedYZ heme-binding membrane subunit
MGGDFRDLPAAWGWLWTALISSFGLAAGMLISRRHWRRTVIWVSVLLLTVCWVPVLGLSGWKVPVALPLMAGIWCGIWAMIYAARHQEPGDA